jgi:spoIIIJ-associated protein
MTRDFEGKSVQDAVKKACLQLNLSADRLRYEIVREETRKIFGLLGGKTAIIRVTVEERESSDFVRELIDSAFSNHIKKEVLAAAPADGEPELAKVVTKEDKIIPSQPPSSVPPAQSEKGEIKDPAVPPIDLEKVKKTLTEILALMDVSVKSVEGRLAPPDCHLVIKEQAAGQSMLISRKGEVLDALQYLINKLYGVRGGRVYVDCGGFRSRHENNIKKLVLKLGAKAKKTRKPVTINALNAHDRRIVHLLIQEDKSLYSRSKGDGEYKKIIIYPKNTYRNRDKNKAKTVKS